MTLFHEIRKKKKKRVKKNTWKFIIQGRGNVKSDEWMFSRFFFIMDGLCSFVSYILLFSFFFFLEIRLEIFLKAARNVKEWRVEEDDQMSDVKCNTVERYRNSRETSKV